MEQREQAVRDWFGAWLRNDAALIDRLFAPDIQYSESWGPEYHGIEAVRHWFLEWNTRGRVLRWDIKQFVHQGDRTAVEWFFRNKMEDGREEVFDGVSLIQWDEQGRMRSLKEFGSRLPHYDPYA